jgi:hypothetical protein
MTTDSSSASTVGLWAPSDYFAGRCSMEQVGKPRTAGPKDLAPPQQPVTVDSDALVQKLVDLLGPNSREARLLTSHIAAMGGSRAFLDWAKDNPAEIGRAILRLLSVTLTTDRRNAQPAGPPVTIQIRTGISSVQLSVPSDHPAVAYSRAAAAVSEARSEDELIGTGQLPPPDAS